MSVLPELPEPVIRAPFLKELRWVDQGDYYNADQVLKLIDLWSKAYAAHGDARAAHARKQALEEAAKVCETQIDPTRSCTTSGFAYWHAKQIKELLK